MQPSSHKMSTPVERWLETFMCQKYTEVFEAWGFKTLQSVCQLSMDSLRSMGVRPGDCEKIMENVTIMRQSFPGSSQRNPNYGESPNSASSMLMNMSRSVHSRGMSFETELPEQYPEPYPQESVYGSPQGNRMMGDYQGSQQMWRGSVPGPHPQQQMPWGGTAGQRFDPHMVAGGTRFDPHMASARPRFEPHMGSAGLRFDPHMHREGPRFHHPHMVPEAPRYPPHMASRFGMATSSAGPRFEPQMTAGHPMVDLPGAARMRGMRPSYSEACMAMGPTNQVVQSPQQVADSILASQQRDAHEEMPHPGLHKYRLGAPHPQLGGEPSPSQYGTSRLREAMMRAQSFSDDRVGAEYFSHMRQGQVHSGAYAKSYASSEMIRSPQGQIIQSPPPTGRVMPSPSSHGQFLQSPSSQGHVLQSPSSQGHALQSPPSQGHILPSPLSQGHMIQSPSSQCHMMPSPSPVDNTIRSPESQGLMANAARLKSPPSMLQRPGRNVTPVLNIASPGSVHSIHSTGSTLQENTKSNPVTNTKVSNAASPLLPSMDSPSCQVTMTSPHHSSCMMSPNPGSLISRGSESSLLPGRVTVGNSSSCALMPSPRYTSPGFASPGGQRSDTVPPLTSHTAETMKPTCHESLTTVQSNSQACSVPVGHRENMMCAETSSEPRTPYFLDHSVDNVPLNEPCVSPAKAKPKRAYRKKKKPEAMGGPLESLHRLAMFTDNQVVDPKSVVRDAYFEPDERGVIEASSKFPFAESTAATMPGVHSMVPNFANPGRKTPIDTAMDAAAISDFTLDHTDQTVDDLESNFDLDKFESLMNNQDIAEHEPPKKKKRQYRKRKKKAEMDAVSNSSDNVMSASGVMKADFTPEVSQLTCHGGSGQFENYLANQSIESGDLNLQHDTIIPIVPKDLETAAAESSVVNALPQPPVTEPTDGNSPSLCSAQAEPILPAPSKLSQELTVDSAAACEKKPESIAPVVTNDASIHQGPTHTSLKNRRRVRNFITPKAALSVQSPLPQNIQYQTNPDKIKVSVNAKRGRKPGKLKGDAKNSKTKKVKKNSKKTFVGLSPEHNPSLESSQSEYLMNEESLSLSSNSDFLAYSSANNAPISDSGPQFTDLTTVEPSKIHTLKGLLECDTVISPRKDSFQINSGISRSDVSKDSGILDLKESLEKTYSNVDAQNLFPSSENVHSVNSDFVECTTDKVTVLKRETSQRSDCNKNIDASLSASDLNCEVSQKSTCMNSQESINIRSDINCVENSKQLNTDLNPGLVLAETEQIPGKCVEELEHPMSEVNHSTEVDAQLSLESPQCGKHIVESDMPVLVRVDSANHSECGGFKISQSIFNHVSDTPSNDISDSSSCDKPDFCFVSKETSDSEKPPVLDREPEEALCVISDDLKGTDDEGSNSGARNSKDKFALLRTDSPGLGCACDSPSDQHATAKAVVEKSEQRDDKTCECFQAKLRSLTKQDCLESQESLNHHQLSYRYTDPTGSTHRTVPRIKRTSRPQKNVFDMFKEFSVGNTNMNNSSDDSECSMEITNCSALIEFEFSDSSKESSSEAEWSDIDSDSEEIKAEFEQKCSLKEIENVKDDSISDSILSKRQMSEKTASPQVLENGKPECDPVGGDTTESATQSHTLICSMKSEDSGKESSSCVAKQHDSVCSRAEYLQSTEDDDIAVDKEEVDIGDVLDQHNSNISEDINEIQDENKTASKRSENMRIVTSCEEFLPKPESDSVMMPESPVKSPCEVAAALPSDPSVSNGNTPAEETKRCDYTKIKENASSGIVSTGQFINQPLPQKYSKAKKRKMGKSISEVIKRITAQRNSKLELTTESKCSDVNAVNSNMNWTGSVNQISDECKNAQNGVNKCDAVTRTKELLRSITKDLNGNQIHPEPLDLNSPKVVLEKLDMSRSYISDKCAFDLTSKKFSQVNSRNRENNKGMNALHRNTDVKQVKAVKKNLCSLRRSSRKATRLHPSARFLEYSSDEGLSEDDQGKKENRLSRSRHSKETANSVRAVGSAVTEVDVNGNCGTADTAEVDVTSVTGGSSEPLPSPDKCVTRSATREDFLNGNAADGSASLNSSELLTQDKFPTLLEEPLSPSRKLGYRRRHPLLMFTKLKKSLIQQEIEKLTSYEMNKINNRLAVLAKPTVNNNILCDLPVDLSCSKSLIDPTHLRDLCGNWNIPRQDLLAMPVYTVNATHMSQDPDNTDSQNADRNSTLKSPVKKDVPAGNHAVRRSPRKMSASEKSLEADKCTVENGFETNSSKRKRQISPCKTSPSPSKQKNSQSKNNLQCEENTGATADQTDFSPAKEREMKASLDSSFSEAEIVESDHSYVKPHGSSTPNKSSSPCRRENTPGKDAQCKDESTEVRSPNIHSKSESSRDADKCSPDNEASSCSLVSNIGSGKDSPVNNRKKAANSPRKSPSAGVVVTNNKECKSSDTGFIAKTCNNMETIEIEDVSCDCEDFTITINDNSSSEISSRRGSRESVEDVVLKSDPKRDEIPLEIYRNEATLTPATCKPEVTQSAGKASSGKSRSAKSSQRRKRKPARYDSDSYSDGETKDSALDMFNLKRTLDIVKAEKKAKKAKLEEKTQQKGAKKKGKSNKKTAIESPVSFRGPIVQMKDEKDGATSCKVLNFTDNDVNKKTIQIEGLAPPQLYNIEEKYPFVCVLCGHPSNYGGLGDLFGPYHSDGSVRVGTTSSSKCSKTTPVRSRSAESKPQRDPAVKGPPDSPTRPNRNKQKSTDSTEWLYSPTKKGTRAKSAPSKSESTKTVQKNTTKTLKKPGTSSPNVSVSKGAARSKSGSAQKSVVNSQNCAKKASGSKGKTQTPKQPNKGETGRGDRGSAVPAKVSKKGVDQKAVVTKAAKKSGKEKQKQERPKEGNKVTVVEGNNLWALITGHQSPPKVPHSLVHSHRVPQEVWVHEDCVVWTNSIYIVGARLCGLDETLTIASQTVCSVCKYHGATIGCFSKACGRKYHYLCAEKEDCFFDESNFTLYCSKHKAKRLKALTDA